jgi:hypothetical protein
VSDHEILALIAALFGPGWFVPSVDGRHGAERNPRLPVVTRSRVVLYRRRGATFCVLTRAVVTQICLN